MNEAHKQHPVLGLACVTEGPCVQIGDSKDTIAIFPYSIRKAVLSNGNSVFDLTTPKKKRRN
jgi:hypothetical protein